MAPVGERVNWPLIAGGGGVLLGGGATALMGVGPWIGLFAAPSSAATASPIYLGAVALGAALVIAVVLFHALSLQRHLLEQREALRHARGAAQASLDEGALASARLAALLEGEFDEPGELGPLEVRPYLTAGGFDFGKTRTFDPLTEFPVRPEAEEGDER
ncbi:MAG: hypothetical protein ACOY45_14055 [Pseudomonadota bacterium]